MSKSSATRGTVAPKLSHRRRARAWFFPWVQLVASIVLAAFSQYLGTDWFFVFTWLVLASLCIIVQDLARPYSRIIRIWYWFFGELLHVPRWKFESSSDEQVVYNPHPHPPPPFWRYRYHVRWAAALLMLLLAWGAAVYQSRITPVSNSRITVETALVGKALLTLFLLAFGLIPYGTLIAGRMGYVSRTTRLVVWAALGVVGALITPLSLQPLTNDWHMTVFGSCLIFLLYTSIFFSQRLWAGRQTLNEVVREVSLSFLRWPEASKELGKVPELIGGRLRHDRAFILLTNAEDPDYLIVRGQYGDYPQIINEKVPIDRSLTGQALRSKQAVVWNDVNRCSYYYQPHPDDDTKAEIAVPIIHNGIVLGVLDVQSRQSNVYGPGDKHLLETIAHILGATIAIDKRDFFFDHAVELLEFLGSRSAMSHNSERDAFNQFAAFAQNVLSTDLVIYFPLSLTGSPVQQPYARGMFQSTPKGGQPNFNLTDPILRQLIAAWRPEFPINESEARPVQEALWTETAARTESVCAVCFVPVGLPQEPLGALFLIFRHPVSFDTRFKFTVLSLAQSLTKLTSQLRYRDTLFEGFGRPEISLHNIVNRRLFKNGVTRLARTEHSRCQKGCCETLEECVLFPLIQRVDDFVDEVYLAESTLPPNFWRTDFLTQLRHHAGNLPERPDGRRPNVSLEEVDYRIERENAWVKLALYRLITEAINNAVIHGNAANITVTVRRRPKEICVLVVNDGLPLPDPLNNDKSKHGIVALLAECRHKLGAQTDTRVGPFDKGAEIEIIIPALPFIKGEIL